MCTQKTTPLMEQYFALKREFADAILFFQVGDFYELFFDDALTAAPILGIALTQRGTHMNKPVPLCGVPLHALDHYLAKLIKAGLHVAIADQLEEARPGTVVKRGVTRVLTPGTLTQTNLLNDKHASYLCSLYCTHDTGGFVVSEILTGQLLATTINLTNPRALEAQLERFNPDEIIVGGPAQALWRTWLTKAGFVLSNTAQQSVNTGSTSSWLASVSEKLPTLGAHAHCVQAALEQLYWYIDKNQPQALGLCARLQLYKAEDFLVLDGATIRNLELVHNMHDGSAQHTLFGLLDHAHTAMGSRLIKKWLLSPLVNPQAINQRLDTVHALIQTITVTQKIAESLRDVGDLERVVGRIGLQRAHLHDYLHVLRALTCLHALERLVREMPQTPLLTRIHEHISPLPELEQLLASALNTDTSTDWLIKPGFNHELEHMRSALAHAQDTILALERAQQERTGISSLKIRYNNVQGYYVEVTKANLHLIPPDYERQQTLANVERFNIPELRTIEHELTRAQANINTLERSIYETIKQEVTTQLQPLRMRVHALATLDALVSFALIAYDNNYCRPIIHESQEIFIHKGMHPVVGHALGTNFIPNDTQLTAQERLVILTGPNMGGKSTYLRQVALICLMAQCGSFVPTTQARLPILDRIFTRIGAGDNVAQGKSTFLVEMEETAAICTQATNRSLVILDEVGRGTSTYDGMAIAHAVIEYIHGTIGAFCLFATHYHELTSLEAQPGIVNYHAACAQKNDKILFLHTIVRGSAPGSFGIHVAQLAQLPAPIITRAQELLAQFTRTPAVAGSGQECRQETARPEVRVPIERELEDNPRPRASWGERINPAQPEPHYTELTQLKNQLDSINPDELSPRQALDALYTIKKLLER